MVKILAKQTNKDGSTTIVYPDADDKKYVIVITGFNPWVGTKKPKDIYVVLSGGKLHRTKRILKDKMVRTLRNLLEKGMDE